jgi:oligopeptide/dipeptide ABC transporter ATP-binding protein
MPLDPSRSVRCLLYTELAPATDIPPDQGPGDTSAAHGAVALAAAHAPALPEQEPPGPVLLDVQNLAVRFPIRRGILQRTTGVFSAVDGVSFQVARGRTLALVGESGCGKTTTGKAIVQLLRGSALIEGSARLDGQDLFELEGEALRAARRDIQIIFQDPFASLDPRMRVLAILEEGLQSLRPEREPAARRAALEELVERVGLRRDSLDRYPHEFSGGQRQRIAIARALMLEPKIVVLDEPVSALDVSIQAQILNLLADLQDQFGLTYIFISHDLSVVRFVADTVMVMYLGRPVEIAPVQDIFNRPQHPYTRALLSATPVADPSQARTRIKVEGELPSPFAPPSGCPFHPRCPFRRPPVCVEVRPPLFRAGPTLHACHGVEQGWIPETPEVIPLSA